MHVHTIISTEIPFAAAEGDDLIAIGDVHGHADALMAVINTAMLIPTLPGAVRKFVFLGDLIDRGPHSLRCIDIAAATPNSVALMGNHEQMLRILINEPTTSRGRYSGGLWAMNGGLTVLNELEAIAGAVPPEGEIRAAIGKTRAAWLDGLQSHFISGQIMAVHAGLNPEIPVDKFLDEPWLVEFRALQEHRHWAWIRKPFLDHIPAAGKGHHGFFVVHGHSTPGTDKVPVHQQLQRSRVNLDGGSFSTGKVRMAHITGNTLTVFEAG
ncbi:ser/threonine protein phosphatase [Camelimonas fluminis]|nr:ser/threonine protein phosphatase [Camelimonas fluminis]